MMPATRPPQRRSTTATARRVPARDAARQRAVDREGSRASKRVRPPAADRVAARACYLFDQSIDYISNETFVGRRATDERLSPFAERVETRAEAAEAPGSHGLPAHLARMCATPLLTPEQEQELFRRMNFCKHRAASIRARLSRTNPNLEKLAEAEDFLRRAERLRNYLIQANTRLVMSIARKFADGRNAFDDLLSQGLASLMHSVEKFDYARGYRFSTYATCAVRRDLYRMVMTRKRDSQRFSTGADEALSDTPDAAHDPDEMTVAGWNHLSRSLQEMLQHLDERERFIVTHRFGLDESGTHTSYSRLGERLGISKERVRQLANRALEKLREVVPEYRLEGLVG